MVVVEFGMQILPVASVEEAARYIARIIHQENKPHQKQSNSVAPSGKTFHFDNLLIKSVSSIPGIGESKATNLMTEFKTWVYGLIFLNVNQFLIKSLKHLVNASEGEILERLPSIGKHSASKIYKFFNEKIVYSNMPV